jgi:predicted ATPase
VARGDSKAVIATATELLQLSEEHGLLQPRADALIFLGWALACSGRTPEGIGYLDEGLGVLTNMGLRFRMTSYLCLSAESHLFALQYAKGLEAAAQALEVVAEIGEQWYVSRLYQVRADLMLRARGSDDRVVEANLRRALAVAQHQAAKGWELRAATSLSRLWVDRGRRDAARDLLAPIFGWFTEGFDTPDLKEAKALLDELG